LDYRKIRQRSNSATKNKRVGKKGNKKLMSEIMATEKRATEKRATEDWATVKFGNEK